MTALQRGWQRSHAGSNGSAVYDTHASSGHKSSFTAASRKLLHVFGDGRRERGHKNRFMLAALVYPAFIGEVCVVLYMSTLNYSSSPLVSSTKIALTSCFLLIL